MENSELNIAQVIEKLGFVRIGTNYFKMVEKPNTDDSEGLHSFTQGLKQVKDKQTQANGAFEDAFPTKSSQLNIKHLDTFFENAPISKQHLDGLIQTHSKFPNRLVTAIEEQFFPHILLPIDAKQAIQAGVKNYIKTMSQVEQF